MDSTALIVDAETMATILGIKRAWLYRLQQQGLPKASRGQFHVPTVVQWFVDRKSDEGAADITEQRKRLYKAQTDKTELENSQIRGELLKTAAVQTAFFELGTRIRTQIEAIEPRLARMLPPDVVSEFRIEIKAALEAISDDVATFADTRDDGEDHPAAA